MKRHLTAVGAVVVLIVVVSLALAQHWGGSNAWGILYCIPVAGAAIYLGGVGAVATPLACSLLYWLLGTDRVGGMEGPKDAILLLAALAGFSVIAAAANRLSVRLARRSACCTCVADVGKAVSSSLDLREVLYLIAEKTTVSMGAKGGLVRLLDESSEKLVATASYGLSEEYLKKGVISVQASAVDQQALRGETVVSPNVRRDSRFQYPLQMRREGLGSMICAPIVVADSPRGVLRLYRAYPSRFDPEDRWLMEALADFAGTAITNALEHEGLQADKDSLDKYLYSVMWGPPLVSREEGPLTEKTARDIMTTRVVTTTASATVAEVATALARNRISGIPVVAEGEVPGLFTKVVGVVTEADILTAPMAAPVEAVMARDVVSVGPETSLSEIVKTLAHRNIKRVPVIDSAGHLVGIVSRADVVAAIATGK